MIIPVELAAVDQLGIRQMPQIVGRIETGRFIERNAAFLQNVGDKL